jgi:hypothetical protein
VGFELRFFWTNLNPLEMAWGDLSHPYFRFPYGGSGGVQGARRGLIPLFVHQESWERSKMMRMEALDEGSLGASFHGGLMEA